MRKLKCFGYSLLPMFMFLAVQSAVALGFSVTVGLLYGFLSDAGNAVFFAEYMKREYWSIVSVLADIVFLIPGYFWLRGLKAKEVLDEREHKIFSPKAGVRIFFLGIILQFITGMILILIQALAPQVMESHQKALESLGMYAPTFWSVLYTVVLAPVAEEVFCRGLTLKILEQAFPFWAANLLQALYFGLIHGNLVQGTYAFVMGILLGIVTRRYATLKAAILFHFSINLFGVLTGSFYPNILQRVLIIVVSMMIIFLFTEKKRNR